MITYKLYDFINFERIVWYVNPGLHRRNITQDDLKAFKGYFQYIIKDTFEIEDSLGEVFGGDIARIIMLFTPDFLSLCREKFCEKIASYSHLDAEEREIALYYL